MREYKLSDTLRETMLKQKVTQKALANKLGVSQPTLHAWRYGRDMKAYDLNNIADYLGVSTDYLITGEVSMYGVDVYSKELKRRVLELKKHNSNGVETVSIQDVLDLI